MLYSAFLWRRGFQRDNWINYSLLAVAFVLHTVAMAKRGFSLQHCPVNNLYEATDMVSRAEPLRTAVKVGRNDPCPCGSGKKYKKCCG